MSTKDNTDLDHAPVLAHTQILMAKERDHLKPQQEWLTFPTLNIGDVIGERYTITGIIGQGGMGKVFAAQHLSTNAKVAIKTVRGDRLASPRATKRFELEARQTASLSHPNIVHVFDYGKQDNVLYLVMEFIDGCSLWSLIEEHGRLPWQRTARVLQQVLMALVAAHESGRQLIHRDIKPDNILVTDVAGQQDFVKVVDFGISKALEGTGTSTGSILGSPHTMAPEQWRGEPVTPATDLYAVGCTAYIALSGCLPFEGKGAEMGLAHLNQQSPDLMPRVDEDTPKTLIDWVEWLMQKQPAHRPQTVRQALDVLNAVLQGTSRCPQPIHTQLQEPHVGTSTRVKLPRFTSSFVGREHELSKLDQLAAQGSRLVTLHGIGGLGKTRLSVEWATACSEDFPGGCYFCDLTEARSLDVICLCLAQALDVPLNEENPVQTLGYALSGRGRLLVIFDNFEQIIAHGSSSIGVWLNMAPEAMFVVTSRQSLGLDGERVVEVEPLQTPGANRHEAIEDNEAVHLFVARAQQTRGDFKLTPDNAQPIAELVRQLDGLPLTIEMAASRIKTLPPAGILSRLSDRFRLLRSSRRDLSGRQVTLLAALDWSWELLDPHEQAALAQCAVFQGSFSLEAAESVLDLSAYEQAPWVADVIESLVDKSLIRVAGDRLLMFVSVHQYAWTKLQQPSMEHELASVRERHAAYFAQYGTPPFLQRLSLSSRAFKELKVELGNLDGALCYAISAGHAHFTGQCALALGKYFYRQGLYEAGLVEVRKALKALSAATEVSKARLLCLFGDLKRVVGRVDDALLHYERALSLACAGGDPRLEGQVLHGLGYTLREQGKLEAALHHFQGALDLARDSRDRCLQGRALYGLGLLLLDQGKLEEAQYHYEGALDLARDSGDRRLEGKALYGLSHLLIDQGGLEEAQHQYRKVIHLARKSGDKRLEGDALCGLGYVLRDQNRSKEALHQYEMALGLALDSGDKRLEAKALYELGYVFKEQAKLEQAQHHFQGALNLARDNGDKHLEGHGLYGLGYVFKEQGHLNAAQHHYQDALNLARDNGDKRLESYSLMGLGHVLREQGDLEQARHYCKETLDLARDSGAKRLESYSLMGLGHVLREQGDLEQALHCCESALGLAHTRSDQRLEATAICGQGHALLEQGRLDEAWPLLREALCLARDNNTQRLEGTILHAFGHALIAQGKLDEAHQHMQEALGIARGNNDTRLESHALLGLVYTAVLGNRHTQALDYLHQAQTLLQHSDSKRLLLLEYDCLQALILACQGQTAQATIVFHSALHQLATLGLKREARLTQLANLVEKAINDARIHLQLAPNSPKLEEELAPEAQDEATPKPKVDAER